MVVYNGHVSGVLRLSMCLEKCLPVIQRFKHACTRHIVEWDCVLHRSRYAAAAHIEP